MYNGNFISHKQINNRVLIKLKFQAAPDKYNALSNLNRLSLACLTMYTDSGGLMQGQN